MITYLNGDCLVDTKDSRMIIHICNNKGGFGKRFALSLSEKYPIVRQEYKNWYKKSFVSNDNKFKLGCIQLVDVDETLKVVNMICQNGYKSQINKVPLDYVALELCLEQVNLITNDIPVWMPKIGTGYAGGDWKKIEEIIKNTLVNKDVFIFNYD